MMDEVYRQTHLNKQPKDLKLFEKYFYKKYLVS